MKSLGRLIKGELYKLIKSNTLYVMTGLLLASILLMTWVYAEQERNVTNALEMLLGNTISTDSFDIIDGEVEELKNLGIDTYEIESFAKQLEDKPEIKLMLLGVEPAVLRNFAVDPSGQNSGANDVFQDYLSFANVQEALYYDYFRSLYYDYQFKYYLNKDILNYIKQSNYNVSFVDYIINRSMKDLFQSYENLFGKKNEYFEKDGLYWQFLDVQNDGTQQEINQKYNELIAATDDFFEKLDIFSYLTSSSVLGTNYLLMPAKNFVSEEYSVLSGALNSVTRRAKSALNIIKQQKLNELNLSVFKAQLFNLIFNLIAEYLPYPAQPIDIPDKQIIYDVPAEPNKGDPNYDSLKQAYQTYQNFLEGLRAIAETDILNSGNLFYAYNEYMIRKAYQYLTTNSFTPIDPGKQVQEQRDLESYIKKFNVSVKDEKLVLDPMLPFEIVINSSYSTIITKDIYNEYFKPYFDDKEKTRLEALMDSINEKLNRYSSAEILFYNLPADSIAALISDRMPLPEYIVQSIKVKYEEKQKEIFAEFSKFYGELKSDFKEFAPRSQTLDSLIKNTNFLTAIEAHGLNDSQARKIQGFVFTSRYMLNSYITQAQFLIENDDLSTNYSAPESLGKGYGAMEFIFVLTDVIIMIFGIVLASGTIAGEHSDGTMKLLLIRPHTRGNVLLAKFLTICLVIFGFFTLNFLITFLIGGVGWGLKGASMALSIFNSKRALILHPAVVVFFLHLFGFLESVVFALIALTISTLFKSRSGATAASMLVYFVSFILDAFLSSFSWYKYVIFNNTNLFQYMSSAGPAIADLTLWFSLTVTLVYVAIMGLICYFTFAKRDAN
ncbi:MAG TPA: ABC transporter permease subunit [Clostridia bacterium]